MILLYKRVIRDIRANCFLNIVTAITITVAVLIVSASALFFTNANAFMTFCINNVRIMAYLEPDTQEKQIKEVRQKINTMIGVEDVQFISKQTAWEEFRTQMAQYASILDNLKENPLPDAFEIRMETVSGNWENFEVLAVQVGQLPRITDVEYGKKWLGRFAGIMDIFRFAGYVMGCLFFMAAVFFVANTIRLVIYSRREEIEIMRMVGATEDFIKTPFYIQAILQGFLGGMAGLGLLFCTFKFMIGDWQPVIGTWKLETPSLFEFPLGDFHIQFLSQDVVIVILTGSVFVGWLGCYLSLRRFLKEK